MKRTLNLPVGGLGEAVRRWFAAGQLNVCRHTTSGTVMARPGMAVLVQAMVDPMAAAVAFTVHPPLLAATVLRRVHGCDA
jgi:hypothetical protein